MSFDEYMTGWLDQNVGWGPPLNRKSPEAREILENLLTDAKNSGHVCRHLTTDELLYLIVRARNRSPMPNVNDTGVH